jgi:hypothetical protein
MNHQAPPKPPLEIDILIIYDIDKSTTNQKTIKI